ncbi:MAG: thioredoxin [Methanomicrobiales archaeon]|nr:thioredoxin [Methanomicrobiales archaeon]
MEDEELRKIREKKMEEMQHRIEEAHQPKPPQPAPKKAGVIVLDERSFQRALQENPRLVVDLWAEWCGPCKMLSPTVEALAGEFAGTITFAKVNTDQNPGIAMRFGISAIPTLLLFSGGRLIDTVVGAYPRDPLRARLVKSFGLTA